MYLCMINDQQESSSTFWVQLRQSKRHKVAQANDTESGTCLNAGAPVRFLVRYSRCRGWAGEQRDSSAPGRGGDEGGQSEMALAPLDSGLVQWRNGWVCEGKHQVALGLGDVCPSDLRQGAMSSSEQG